MNNFNIHDIRNDFDSYNKLINLYYSNKNKWIEKININLTGCFSANTSSMFGAILTKFQDDLNTVTITVESEKTERTLEKNGFLSFFDHEKITDNNNTTIPYQILSANDDRYFNNYVFKEFISKSNFPQMTVAVKRKLTESIYEIFINAKMHSKTDKIFVCGQFFPKKEKIEFMIVDIGIGIKNVVNNRFSVNLPAVKAIEWVIQDRNTTKKGVSGGIGLSLLHEFIKRNKGKVQIVSNEGFWQLENGSITTNQFENEFPGTMVNISVRTDDQSYYMLKSEINDDIF